MLLETSELSSALDDEDRALQAQSDAQFALAQIYVIDSQDSLVSAADELNAIQMIKRRLERRQAEITKPINDALTSIRALFKPAARPASGNADKPFAIFTSEMQSHRVGSKDVSQFFGEPFSEPALLRYLAAHPNDTPQIVIDTIRRQMDMAGGRA